MRSQWGGIREPSGKIFFRSSDRILNSWQMITRYLIRDQT
jgi:hypothetical protein